MLHHQNNHNIGSIKLYRTTLTMGRIHHFRVNRQQNYFFLILKEDLFCSFSKFSFDNRLHFISCVFNLDILAKKEF